MGRRGMQKRSVLSLVVALTLMASGVLALDSASGADASAAPFAATGGHTRAAVIERAHAAGSFMRPAQSPTPSPSSVHSENVGTAQVWFQGNLSPPQNFSGGGGSCWASGDCLAVASQTIEFNDAIPRIGPALPASFVSNSLPYALPALSCVDADFCMLANTANGSTPGFFLFDGTSWQTLPSPTGPFGTQIYSLSCASTTLCVATGYHEQYPDVTSYVWEYDGSSWSLANLPSPPSGATTPVGSTSVGCSGTFCLVGPIAQNAAGDVWMATLSAGVWAYSEINTLSPIESTTNGQLGAVSCWTAGSCMVGVAVPATATAGFVTYSAGSWSSLVLSALSQAYNVPALSCVSAINCVAGVTSSTTTDLEQLSGSSWSEISGTVWPVSNNAWTLVSCAGGDGCLATSSNAFAVQHPPFPTSVSLTSNQVGAREVDLQATVNWPVVTYDDLPGPISYLFDGSPIDGCADLAMAHNQGGTYSYPDCDIVFAASGSTSFATSLTSNAYYAGSTSPSVTGTVGGGYWQFGADGSVYPFGAADWFGDASNMALNAPIVGGAITPFDDGYWLLGSDGGVFSYADAPFYGSTGNLRLNKPVVGMASTPDGGGYWFVATDGGVFSYGDAAFYGSTGALHLKAPIVGMAATPDGGGYWLVASDGGIFAFGDAPFYGSTGSLHLNNPVVGMAATPDGGGYWLVASDGGIFAFGDAPFYGSTGNIRLDQPIVGMATTPDGGGYWLVASDGGLFTFGDARFYGSNGGAALPGPIVGMAST